MATDKILKLVLAVFVTELAGVVGSFFTSPAIPGWYAALTKPASAPPNWVFAPVWTTLFALLGVAVWLIWLNGFGRREVKVALAIFAGQLVLNVFWSVIFFGWKNPGGAFGEIIFLWLAILATIIAFARVSKLAAWLLVPYLLWVSFAGYLNFSLWQLNNNSFERAVCTLEAKLCPDGSAVGRVGSNCEFAPCPQSAKEDLIRVFGVQPGQTIKSPLTLKGEARGYWFFEASFPVKLYDANDNLLATGLAQAQKDWMTENFVPFEARLEFSEAMGRGTLVLEKDNPAGRPENADQLVVPVRF